MISGRWRIGPGAMQAKHETTINEAIYYYAGVRIQWALSTVYLSVVKDRKRELRPRLTFAWQVMA